MILNPPATILENKAAVSPCSFTSSNLEKLSFDIHSWSSYSGQYHPKNILVSKPNDQSSRWSSGSNNQMQFITLKLQKTSIVRNNFDFYIR